MAGLSTGAGAPVVKVYHEKSMILPDVSRVLACLYEKNVQFETVKDSYKDILRLQATRSVPVPFYDGPTFRQESRAICRYIAETYEQHGYPFLLGKDVLERASIEQWLRHEEHAFDPPSRALFCHLAFPLQDEDISDLDREKRKLEEVLEVYEQRLGESEFLAGNKFTLADLVHLPNTHHIVTSDKFAYLYDSRKNVQRWWNTISSRDSWQRVVRDMQSVEEQYQMEEELELEEEQFQQQQWQTEPPQPSGGRNIRIDSRKQTGSDSRTILVPPPRDGIVSSSFFTVPQEHQTLPAQTTSHGKTSPDQRKENNFFSTTEKTPSPSKQRTSATQKSSSSAQSTTSNFFTPATLPTTTKMFQRTDSDKSTSKHTSSPTSQGSSKEAPDRLHLSDFYQTSNHTEEAAIHTEPTSQEASKTSDRVSQARQTGEAPHKPSPGSAKAPQEIAPDKTTKESFSSVQSTTSTFLTPATQEITPDNTTQKSSTSVQSTTSTFFTQATPPATTKMPQRTDTDKSSSNDASSPTRPNQGISKEAPDKLHLSDLSPMQEEYEDTQGGNERFSTKRLRKILEQSDEALKLQSTDLQVPPEKEETPSAYKKPPHMQDRKGQADKLSVDGRTDGTPSTGTRAPDTPTSAAERRDTSPLKEGMAPDGHGATEPRKSTSINEQQPALPRPSQSRTSSVPRASASSNGAPQDDGLAQLSTIDQWRHTSTPATEQGPPGAPSIDKLDKTGGVNRRAQPSPPKKTTTEQSDKSPMDERTPRMTPRQAPPSDTRRTSASTLPSQEPVSSLQQTTKPVKGETPASSGITGEESADIAMADESGTPPAPLQTPASDGRRVSTDLQGRILDAHGENEAVKPSVTDPRGIPTMPNKQESTPSVQRRTNTTSDKSSDIALPLPSFADKRNEKTGITESTQTTTIGPDERPGGRAPKNSGNKPISSNDIDKQITEAVFDRSSATSREMPPLVQEKSMKQQQLRSDNSSLSPQDNRRQGSEAALPMSGKESEEQTSPDTQQAKNNRKSDGSSKPTRFDGNEGDVTESQSGGSSTNP